MEIAVLALGCFWGPEIKFSKVNGVVKTEVGYCGGNSAATTYKEVCTGTTNHAEVVKIDFDEKIISYEKILDIFFESHDPTTLNSQGPDFGTQYRSEIFYFNESQKKIAERFTLAGELVGITVDGIQLGLINNVIINFARNFRENWSIGITVINVEAINNALGIDAIVVPYLGLQKKF